MTSRHILSGLVALFLFVAADLSSVAAQPAADLQAAKNHYQRRQELVTKKQYRRALAEFSAGYELSNRSAFLFNMAECARLTGETKKARSLYRQYLKVAAEGALAEQARARRKALPAPANASPTPASPTTPPPTRLELKSDRGEPSAADLSARALPDQDPGRGKRVGGFVTGAAGIALLGAGSYFGLQWYQAYFDLEDKLSDGSQYGKVHRDLEARIRWTRPLSIGLLSTGAFAAATGGVLYYLGREDDGKPASLSVVPTSKGAAVLWSGEF